MPRYINEDDFCEYIRKNTTPSGAEWFISKIKDMPSADVVEVKHGVWIPVKLGMPEDNVPVNITWVNRNPVSYYSHIKDKPFTATAVYFHGKWYWFSATVTDMLAEYGRSDFDEFADAIEVIAWMPLPEPYVERKETE